MIFFYPFLSFYYPIPDFALYGFVITNLTAPLLGLIISMNIYALIHSSCIFSTKAFGSKFNESNTKQNKTRKKSKNQIIIDSSFFSGPSLSLFSAVCANCSPFISIFSISLLGMSGGTTLVSFLTIHQTDLENYLPGMRKKQKTILDWYSSHVV